MKKKFDKNVIIYVILGIGIIIVQNLIFKYIPNYSRLLNLIVWGIVFTILQLKNINLQRYQNVKDKLIFTSLIMVGYYIVYFALGFFYGYNNNPYSQKITAIIENIIFIICLNLIQEYSRYKILHSVEGIFSYAIITILFVMFSLEINDFSYYFSNTERAIEYCFGEIAVIIIYSSMLTYFTLSGGIKLSFTYTILSKIGIILMPILPKLNWFISCVLEIVTALLLILIVHYINTYRNRNVGRKEMAKASPAKTIPVIIILTIFTLFVAGILPYKPVAVMSNSMVPTFSRGDVIVIKKLEQDDIKYLKEGDVIEYKVESGNSVVHRIVKINIIDDELVFTTKGDNNVSEDTEKVHEQQIKGIITVRVPYIGFPSVYFSQYILNINPTIDT